MTTRSAVARDADAMLAMNAKIIYCCSPNNPKQDDMQKALDALREVLA